MCTQAQLTQIIQRMMQEVDTLCQGRLTAAILYGAAVLLSFGQSLGYGVFMAVNLLGYFQLERQKQAQRTGMRRAHR